MAFPPYNYKMILILELIIMLLLNVSLFRATNGAPLDDVCRRAADWGFCSSNFGSNPQTRNADLLTLGRIAIDRVNNDIGNRIYAKITALAKSAQDPTVKNLLAECQNSYAFTLYELRVAEKNYGRRVFDEVSFYASESIKVATSCERSFVSPYRSPLTSENGEFANLCDIIRIIADDLNAGKRA